MMTGDSTRSNTVDLSRCMSQKYTLDGAPLIRNFNGAFAVEGNNRKLAVEDIMLCGKLLFCAHEKNDSIPLFSINQDDIHFRLIPEKPEKYCHFCVTSIDQYTLILHFMLVPDERNSLSGDIYYTKDGNIGRYNILLSHEGAKIIILADYKKNSENPDASENFLISEIVFQKGKHRKRRYPRIKVPIRIVSVFSTFTVVSTLIFILFSFISALSVEKNIIYVPDFIDTIFEFDDTEAPLDIETTTSETVIQKAETAGETESVETFEPIQKIESSETVESLQTDTIDSMDSTEEGAELKGAVSTEKIELGLKGEDSGILLIELTSSVSPGDTATVRIQGIPGIVYSIAVYYSSGKSKAGGLEDATADSDGYVEWSWLIGTRTKSGSYKIEVSGGGDSLEFTFEVA